MGIAIGSLINATHAVGSASAPNQLYHMARAFDDGTSRYTPAQSMFSMLSNNFIQGQATKGYFARPEGVRSVSFTATGIEGLSKLVSRRSEFGICFERRLIDPLGTDIMPVHYLERGAIEAIVRDGVYPRGLSEADRSWIDLDEPGVYSFSWENEWRKLGDLFFDRDSVVFIIAPVPMLSAELFALGHPIIPSAAIRNPEPHMKRVAQLVELARQRTPPDLQVDEARVEEGYLTWLAHQYSSMLYGDFYPKIRAEMRRDEEREIYTDSGELRDPNGEWNPFEASAFDLDNMLDEIFEDED